MLDDLLKLSFKLQGNLGLLCCRLQGKWLTSRVVAQFPVCYLTRSIATN